MKTGRNIILFLATGGFSGNIPVAPGTFGTLVGLPLCFLLANIETSVAALIILSLIIFGVWIADEAEKILETEDPGCIVIDEIAGLAVTFIGISFTWTSAIAGFAAFRFFDILKPFPVKQIERRVHGGAGIMLDDVVAGIFANIVLRLIMNFVG